MGNKLDTPYRYIHFVNHSHVDHTWWNSPQACRERNEQIIDSMLSACESNAEFKFSYETTSGLMSYLEKYPGRKKDIHSLLESGRLAIGGLFVSANTDAVSEEAVARNFYFGARWLEKTLGYSPRIANEYDTPGHTLQTPQLVRSAGMDALVITRGPRGSFYWTGPDGSEIFTLCVPYNWSYWRKLGVDFEQTEMNLPPELKRAEESYPGPHLVIPDGDDMTLPNISLPEIVERWNENYDRPKLLLSTMREAIDKIRAKKLPRRSGDMPNLWAVVHALQAETTREMKETQNLLAVAEALYAMRCTEKGNFKAYPAAEIDSCWKRALLATDHNWGGHEESGHAAEGDEYKGNLAKDALRDCHKLIEGAVEGLAHALPKEGVPEEMPVLAFNPVSWSRTDVISVEVSCSIPGLEAIEIVDDKKQPVPYSTTVLEKHDDDTILRARADFLGRDLPPLGYSTYFAKPIMDRKEPQTKAPREGAAIENEFYRVEFSEDGGSIKSLYDKELDLELAGRFPASAGSLEFEFGMFELFGVGLRLSVPDRSFFENPDNEGTGESVELTGEIWRARDYPAEIRTEQNSDFSQALVVEGGFSGSKRRQEVVLYSGLKRVDLHLELDWNGQPDTVLYLQMPNAFMNGQKHLGVPFAVHEDGNELADFWFDEAMPVRFKTRGVQDWLCFEESGRGLAIATRWPIVDLTMVPAFPLLWTNDSSGFFFGERYRQAGKHSFSFSLTSYEGGWRENGIHLWGKQWSKPPLTFIGDESPTKKQRSYVSVDSDNIVISAFKKAQDEQAVVVRLYEAAGKKTTARLRTSFPIKSARMTNLIETADSKLASQENSVKMSFRPFEIRTVKLYI